MKAFMLVAAALLFASSLSCSTDRETIEERIESALNANIPGSFDVVKEDSVIAIGDYGVTYILEYQKRDYKVLLESIDLSGWEEIAGGNYKFEAESADNAVEVIHLWTNRHQLEYMSYKD